MTTLISILFVAVYGSCSVALCHLPFRAWLLAPFRHWIGWDNRRRPKQ